MNYCKVILGVASTYSLRQLKKDNKHRSLSAKLFDDSLPQWVLDDRLAEYDVFTYVIPELPNYDPLIEKVIPGEILNASGTWTQQWITVPLNVSEVVQASKKAEREAKIAGVLFEGVMCSATTQDMTSLSAIESWVVAGQPVNFEFDNGNVVTLTAANIDAFRAVWVPFRASFF
jgi:hypothetical protein